MVPSPAATKTSRELGKRLSWLLRIGTLRDVLDELASPTSGWPAHPPPFPPKPSRAPLSTLDSSGHLRALLLGVAASVERDARFRRACFSTLLERGANPWGRGEDGRPVEWCLKAIVEEEVRAWCTQELERARYAQRKLERYEAPEDVKEWMRAELAALEAEPVVQVVAEQPGQGDTTMQDAAPSAEVARPEARPAKRLRSASPLPDYEDAQPPSKRASERSALDAFLEASKRAQDLEAPFTERPHNGARSQPPRPGQRSRLTQQEAVLFAPLIVTLRKLRANEQPCSSSELGTPLRRQFPDVYKRDPELSSWKLYGGRAAQLGIITLEQVRPGVTMVRLNDEYAGDTAQAASPRSPKGLPPPPPSFLPPRPADPAPYQPQPAIRRQPPPPPPPPPYIPPSQTTVIEAPLSRVEATAPGPGSLRSRLPSTLQQPRQASSSSWQRSSEMETPRSKAVSRTEPVRGKVNLLSGRSPQTSPSTHSPSSSGPAATPAPPKSRSRLPPPAGSAPSPPPTTAAASAVAAGARTATSAAAQPAPLGAALQGVLFSAPTTVISALPPTPQPKSSLPQVAHPPPLAQRFPPPPPPARAATSAVSSASPAPAPSPTASAPPPAPSNLSPALAAPARPQPQPQPRRRGPDPSAYVTMELRPLPPYVTRSVLQQYLLRGPSCFAGVSRAADLERLDELVAKRGIEYTVHGGGAGAGAGAGSGKGRDEAPPVPRREDVVVEVVSSSGERRIGRVTYASRRDAERAKALFGGKRIVEGPAGVSERGVVWMEKGSEVARFRAGAAADRR